MHCNTITSNLLTVVRLLVKISTSIENPKGYFEEYLSTRQNPLKLTSSKPVIYPSLSSFFSFRSMLRFHSRSHQIIGYWWITVEKYFINIAYLYGNRKINLRMKCTATRKHLSFLYLIKERYFLCRGPSIIWKNIVEAIYIKSLQ